VLFDPATLTAIYRFGAKDDDPAAPPGTFWSPDTLIIDPARDLMVITDQGHDRAQGFRLSEIQRRACLPVHRRLALSMPTRAVAGRTVALRLEVLIGDRVDRSLFAAEATVGEWVVPIVDGVGSATLPVAGAGPTRFTARLGDLTASRTVVVVADPPLRPLTGVLAAEELTWRKRDGVIALTGSTVVPAGQTLAIEAGALVELGGDAELRVEGDLVALGTEEEPISLYAADPAQPWGTVFHASAGAVARYQHVFVTGGGDAPATAHCCGPAVRVENGALRMTRSLIADGPGKGLDARLADVELTRTQFARLAMGAEIRLDRARVDQCHFYELRGLNDDDGLYFAAAGDYQLAGSAFAHGDDDGLDLEYATIEVRDVVIRDFGDKAVSITGRDPLLRDCLLVGSRIGVEVKDYVADAPAAPRIERCTIAGHAERGFYVRRREDEQPDIRPVLREVILWDSPVSVWSDFDPAAITIDYSDVQFPAATSGVGNLSLDPRFVDPAAIDYRLGAGSPAATAGATGGPIGWPGFPDG
jgi:hypothetical protein